MPIYEFHCSKCKNDFEKLLPTTKWQGTPCPNCGSKQIAKKMSTFAAQTANASFATTPPCGASPHSCGGSCPHMGN